MYDRRVANQQLTFGVSGKLWNRSLIMYDPETKTEWSHILGLAMDGKLKGKRLEQIPSVMTDWETWKKDHPKTTVLWLSFTDKNYKKDFYSVRNMGRIVLGMSDAKVPHAWQIDALVGQPILNQQLDDRPVLITFDADSVTARMFSRVLEGTTLDFVLRDNGDLVDQQSKSRWDRTTGKCISGHYDDQHLKALPAFLSYKHVWKRFHPNTKFWPPETN